MCIKIIWRILEKFCRFLVLTREWSAFYTQLIISCEELTHWKRLWCWEGLRVGGEVDNRGWDGWVASPTRWTWVWVSSGSWWWTGRPGVLQSMGLQRVRHDWATELNWIISKLIERHMKRCSTLLIIQFSSVAQSYLTIYNPMNCSTPGLPVPHQHSELTQTHVHRVSDAIKPSHPLSYPSSPAFNFPQHQGLSQWVNISHQVAKVLEFQLQYQPFQWIFRTDFL